MLTNRDSHNSVSWNVMPGASRYELRESINGAPYTLVYNGAGLNWSPPSPKPIGRYGYTLSVCPTTTTCGAPSAPVTEEVVPGAPTGLNLNPESSTDGNFSLSWNPVSGAEGYQVEEKAEGEAEFQVVATVDAASNPRWDASGKPAGDYQYRVRSCLTLCGNPSSIVTETVTSGGDTQTPGAPTMNPPGPGSSDGQQNRGQSNL
mgnify:CR=1 FL=1